MHISIRKLTKGDLVMKDIHIDCDPNQFKSFCELLLSEGYDVKNSSVPIEQPSDEPVKEMEVYRTEVLTDIDKLELSDNSKKSYKRLIIKAFEKIDELNIATIINDSIDDVIKNVETISESSSTRKSYFSAILKVIDMYGLKHGDVMKKQIENYRMKCDIEQDKKKEETAKTKEEGDDIIKGLKEKMETYKGLLKKEWNNDAIFYCLCYIYTNYGVLRPEEFREMYIYLKPPQDAVNYIDLKKKEIVINQHKTMKKDGTRIIKIDDELVKVLKLGAGKPFFNKVYYDSSKVSGVIKKNLGMNPYAFRKAVVSSALASNDIELINKVAKANGHEVKTQISYYNQYKN